MAKLAPADEGHFLDRILESTYEIWHEGLSFETYRRFYTAQRATAWGQRHLHRVALVDGDTLLASAKHYAFDATLDGRAIRVAGIAAVFTEPAHRAQGAARELMDLLLRRLAADGADLALLFSEIGPDYYARLGFNPVATSTRRLRVAEPTRYGAPATMVRGGEARDLAAIAAMGRKRASTSRFHLDRDEDLIQYAITKRRLLAGLGRPGLRELFFFIAEEGTTAAAYVVITSAAGRWTIEECGDRDPTGARVGAILQVMLAREPAERRPSIDAWLPEGFLPPQVTMIGEEPSAEVMMIKPLTTEASAATTLTASECLYWKADVF
jgi:predicted N-acetyltransferase YhbS